MKSSNKTSETYLIEGMGTKARQNSCDYNYQAACKGVSVAIIIISGTYILYFELWTVILIKHMR